MWTRLILGVIVATAATAQADKKANSEFFSCLHAANNPADCDVAQDQNGEDCVWCVVFGVGACWTQTQASLAKTTLMAHCDGDDDGDDGTTAPDDYDNKFFTCMTVDNEEECPTGTQADCVWCNSSAGYGVCLDRKSAEHQDKGTFYTCNLGNEPKSFVKDTSDMTCVMASMAQDESTCEGTVDQEGNACVWCSVAGYDMCLSQEQSGMAGQFGAMCGDRLKDPSDMSCAMATLTQDESSCVGTSDDEGNSCLWCNVAGYDVCLSPRQSSMAGQFGATCGSKKLHASQDMTCTMATLSQDESVCEGTSDVDGNACVWCNVAGYDVCLSQEQSSMAGQFGAMCGDKLKDPTGMNCFMATMSQDEESCENIADEEGNACVWCNVAGYHVCLSQEQSSMAGQFGAMCGDKLKGVTDLTCMAAMVSGGCDGATDKSGNDCLSCSIAGQELCLSQEQSGMASQIGVSCSVTATE